MIYILGVEINEAKPLAYNLQKLYGINISNSLKICSKLGLNPYIPLSLKLINQGVFLDIQKYVARYYNIGTVLRKLTHEDIKEQIKLKSYKGMRHRLHLPVRGQRTHTNRLTQRKLTHY